MMPVTFDNVRKIALSLESVEEGTSYGTAAFKARGTLFLRLKEDGDSLVVRADFDQRDALIAEDPTTYYITDHYLKYEWVLVRLSRVYPDAMRDLIRMAWRSATAAASTKRQTSRPPRAPRR
jgi:hypothetical protein